MRIQILGTIIFDYALRILKGNIRRFGIIYTIAIVRFLFVEPQRFIIFHILPQQHKLMSKDILLKGKCISMSINVL